MLRKKPYSKFMRFPSDYIWKTNHIRIFFDAYFRFIEDFKSPPEQYLRRLEPFTVARNKVLKNLELQRSINRFEKRHLMPPLHYKRYKGD